MKNFFANLITRALGLGKNLVAFLLPIVTRHGAALVEAGLPIALQIVTSLENSAASGTQKRAQAVAALREALLREGRATASELSAATLNWIVETALQKARAPLAG
jgi:hypothetical protein